MKEIIFQNWLCKIVLHTVPLARKSMLITLFFVLFSVPVYFFEKCLHVSALVKCGLRDWWVRLIVRELSCYIFLATFLVTFLMTQMLSKDWILFFSQSLYIDICFSSSVIIKYTFIRLQTFSYWILYLIAQCAHVFKRWTPTREKQAWMAFCYLQCCQTEWKKRGGQKQTVISFGSENEPSRFGE